MTDKQHSLSRREVENSLFLKGVDLESVQGLLEDCPVRDVKQGEVVIQSGEINHSLYLLISGRLRVHSELGQAPLAMLDAGEFVGELSLIQGQPTSAYVVSDQECRMLVLDENTVWSLVESCPSVGRNLLFVLAQRLRQGNSLLSTGKELQRRSQRAATIDPLTGLFNGRWLKAQLASKLEGYKRKGNLSFSALLLAIDHFRLYEKAHGREAGDRALYTIARTLRSKDVMSGEGEGSDEMAARYGDDEFIVLLPNTEASGGREIGERIRRAVSEAKVHDLDEKAFPTVTISVGVVQLKADDTSDTFTAAAESGLERARLEGGNRVCEADRLT